MEKLKLIKNFEIEVELLGELKESNDEGFYALYYNIKPNKYVNWFPENAHVSFRYKYSPFSNEEKTELQDLIKIRKFKFNLVEIRKCSGHYKDWKALNIH